MARFKSVTAAYTGGNIWLFYGELTDGEYFMTDNEGATILLNAPATDFNESLEWQEEHKIKELLDESERVAFCDSLAERLLRHNKADDLGGITDSEIRAYKKFWRIPF